MGEKNPGRNTETHEEQGGAFGIRKNAKEKRKISLKPRQEKTENDVNTCSGVKAKWGHLGNGVDSYRADSGKGLVHLSKGVPYVTKFTARLGVHQTASGSEFQEAKRRGAVYQSRGP